MNNFIDSFYSICMATLKKDIVSINLFKVAAVSAFAMILFFMLMKMADLVTLVEFRFLNFIIMFLGIRYSLMNKRASNQGKLEYLPGMLSGFLTALFTSIFFAVFVYIYLTVDYNFMDYLKETQPFGSYLVPISAAMITVIEGVAGGSIISFAVMNLYNRDNQPG